MNDKFIECAIEIVVLGTSSALNLQGEKIDEGFISDRPGPFVKSFKQTDLHRMSSEVALTGNLTIRALADACKSAENRAAFCRA